MSNQEPKLDGAASIRHVTLDRAESLGTCMVTLDLKVTLAGPDATLAGRRVLDAVLNGHAVPLDETQVRALLVMLGVDAPASSGAGS